MSFLVFPLILLLCLAVAADASPHQVNIKDSLLKPRFPALFLNSRSNVSLFPAGQLCPRYNTTTLQTTSGSVFEVDCGVDYTGGDMHMVYVANLTACALACDTEVDCVAASLSGSACYLKSKLNPAKHNSGINAVKLISRNSNTTTVSQSYSASLVGTSSSFESPTIGSNSSQILSGSSSAASTIATTMSTGSSMKTGFLIESSTASLAPAMSTPSSINPVCPRDNGTLYFSTSGDTYLVECYVDRYGHDIGSVSIPSLNLADCINACSDNAGCVDVSLSGSACYMKYAAGDSYNVARQIQGARRISVGSVSVNSSFASSSSSPTSAAVIHTHAPTCPGSNGTQYLVSNGAIFAIECFMDRYGNDLKMRIRMLHEGENCTIYHFSAIVDLLLLLNAGFLSRFELGIQYSFLVPVRDVSSCIFDVLSPVLEPAPSTTTSSTSSSSTPTPTGAPNGAACGSPTDCRSGACLLFQCADKSQIGGFCGIASDCAAGRCNYQQNTCVTGDDGTACKQNSDCSSYHCNSQNICGASSDGATCAYDSDCKTFCNANRICGKVQDGSSCAQGGDCLSGFCNGMKTCGVLNDGATCAQHTDCISDICNVASYCGPLTTCFPTCPQTAGWSCQTSESASPQCVFTCPSGNIDKFGNCRTVSDGTFVGLQYANPGSPWPATGEEIWYAVTCCAPDGSSCYNKFPNFAESFYGGQDPKTRQPSATWGACSDAGTGATCDWGSSFSGGGFIWNLNAGFLDRSHLTATSAMGTVQVDNSGTMYLEYPGTTFHCQTADLSVLYYDNGNPCVADLECQPPPSGGTVIV
ncbi:hypothetical protein KCU85_g2715, partial [Aureobasidium melanogenum]